MTNTVFARLLQQALSHCTAADAAHWPCELYSSRHWHTLAADGRWRVCVRTEPDDDSSGSDYEEPPPEGTEWVGVVTELQDSYGKCWRRADCWGIATPGLRPVPALEWQDCEAHIAEIARDCLQELLDDPAALISNLRGEIAERSQMIGELQEVDA